MNELENRYKEVTEERNKVIDRINALQRHHLIKEYNELKAANGDLLREQKDLANLMKMKEYETCDHVLVNTYQDWECSYYGCIKCGLHEDVLITFDNSDSLMYDYLSDQHNYFKFRQSRILDSSCDLELAQAIYQKITESHPDVDDDTLVKYFRNALDHMRSDSISQDRQVSRVKRLHLSNNFINWKN